ncbi:MAG: recombinase family protein [Aeromicrobium sp.]|uniref:recombinase family protein n=1 Tax=Aeromicrobium sp. TaxID=1871063 RepID=UPI0039E383CC
MGVEGRDSGEVRAVVYLRISLDREGDELGISRNREDAVERIEQRGWTFVREYVDNDTSGSGRAKRPGFEQMLADVEAGLVDAIVAQEWPRLERNRPEGVRLIETCKRRRVFVSLVKGLDMNFDNAIGRMVGDMLSAQARAEIEIKAERQSRAQRQRAEQGRTPKGMRALGYATGGATIPDEAEAVRAVYRAFARGATIRSIARALSGETGQRVPADVPATRRITVSAAIEANERRVAAGKPPRKVPEEGPWHASVVLGILRNPRYVGYSCYAPVEDGDKSKDRARRRDTIVRDGNGDPVRGVWEPLVDEELWWRVQAELDRPERRTYRGPQGRKRLGASLYHCGYLVAADTECGLRVKSMAEGYGCPGHLSRSKEDVDAFVEQVVKARLGREDLRELLPRPDADEPRMRAIEEELTRQRGKVARAQQDYDDELIEAIDLKRVREATRGVIAGLERERLRLTAGSATSSVIDVDDPVAAYNGADLATRRAVIDVLCRVTLLKNTAGKAFTPDSVRIDWRGGDDATA